MDLNTAWMPHSCAICHTQITQPIGPQSAGADLKMMLALEPPQDAQICKELESTQKLMRKIEVEEEKSAVEACR